jgi:hypothetical protein
MASSPSTPEERQGVGNKASTASDSDANAAGQADAGDTSFAGEGNAADRQPVFPKEAEVNIPQAPGAGAQVPQKGTGLDSPDADTDQADAGDTSMDPGKDKGS